MSRIVLMVDSRPVTVDEGWTIRQLYEEVGRKKSADIESFYLTYGGRNLDLNRDGSRRVKEYHFQNNEALVFTQRAHGGGSNLRALPGHVQLTKEACCVTFDDDKKEWRAKLNCGHAISVEATRDMLRVTLESGGYEFSCPSCRRPMEWIVVRHILSSAMSANELQRSLDKINQNFEQWKPGIKKCDSCGTNLERDFTKKWYAEKARVVCNECTRRAGHEVSVCWHCLKPWQSGYKGCGNRNCDGAAAKVMELKECSTKKIGSVTGCPNTRACPLCGVLIYHVDKCKHMPCTQCRCNFCFVCLRLQNSDESWPCGSSSDPCNVAPRQTSIPNA